MESCDAESKTGDECDGPAQVSIYWKGEDKPFQVIKLELLFQKKEPAYNSSIDKKPRGIYDDSYTFIFDDFNFDGNEDLAICTGTRGGYGAPSYDVYLFNRRLNKFVESKALSRLTEEVYLGLFYTDPKRRVLHAYWKSGAAFHAEEIYKVVNDRPVLIEKTEQEPDQEVKYWIITTRKKIKGRWVKTIKREKIKDNPWNY